MKRCIFPMPMFIFLVWLTVQPAAEGAVTFKFDPNDLIQIAPSEAGTSDTSGENKATQVNARRVHDVWGKDYYETFHNPSSLQTQPDSYNTYRNWRDGLGSDEGISGFNIWLLDNPRARSWGETVVWNPDGPKPSGTADADGNWNVQTIANPWGEGWLVQWWTEDSAHYINNDSDIGEFSFSGSPYFDDNFNTHPGFDGDDPPVEIGATVRIWFGAANWTEEDGEQNWSVHFDDQGWGQRSAEADAFAAGLIGEKGYGSGYEGVLSLKAVPEPATMAIWSLLALVGIGLVSRRRRRQA